MKVARTWAVEQELPYSKDPEYAEDNLNGLYEVAVLHQLHCLVSHIILYTCNQFVE